MLKIFVNNRGIALLITISVTTILVAGALEYNRRARLEVISTASTRDRMTLFHMASSGVHAAMALLVKDKSESNFDSLQEDWANPEKIDEILQAIPFESGKLTVNISDELSRIQINALVTYSESREFNQHQIMVWDRFLRIIGDEEDLVDDSDPVAIVNSVKDWLDSNDDDATTGLSGAESSYYEGLDPPYVCRNGPIMDMGELLLIKGITPKLFYGTKEGPGLLNHMTVYGMAEGAESTFNWPGRININTADLPVLAALLPSEYADLVQAWYDYRQEIVGDKDVHDFSSPKWYKNVTGFDEVILDPNLITIASDIFRIESEATLNETKTAVTAVVQRIQNAESGKWECKVLSWQME